MRSVKSHTEGTFCALVQCIHSQLSPESPEEASVLRVRMGLDLSRPGLFASMIRRKFQMQVAVSGSQHTSAEWWV